MWLGPVSGERIEKSAYILHLVAFPVVVRTLLPAFSFSPQFTEAFKERKINLCLDKLALYI
jgi:hypothetical protein